MSKFLVEVKNLSKTYRTPGTLFEADRVHQALKNISLGVKKGQTLGLVGESGSGKSTLGRCVLRLIQPTSGEIYFNGENITQVDGTALRSLRKKMQMVFQDPYSSLNPRMKIGAALMEPLIIHRIGVTKEERLLRVKDLLNLVGLNSDAIEKYPNEFSGGQRQRIGIARALAVEPELIICDEPVSALDVSVQAQVVNLLLELQEKFQLTYIFISHDLRLVSHLSHRVAVLKNGSLVEEADGANFLTQAQHPYSKQLIASLPHLATS